MYFKNEIFHLKKYYSLQKDYSYLLFDIAIFIMPTTLSISAILLIICSLKNIFCDYKLLFYDNWNKSLLISSFLLTLSCLWNYFDKNLATNYPSILMDSPYFVGLFNWIPLFILFIGCQPYLNSQTLRKKFALILLAGTFPVLFMGILQGFFGIYGPFKSPLNLIVWFQRPINSITDLTSIFNNPNYYGSWLNIIWPFCLATTLGFSKKIIPQLFKLFFLVLTPLSIVLTSSRGAWLGLIFSLIFFFGKRGLKLILPILFIIGLLCLSIMYPILGLNFQEFLKELIPSGLWINIIPSSYDNIEIERLEIWNFAIQKISERPFWGFGASYFPKFLEAQTSYWRGHAHNLPLELAFSFGLPAAISVIFPVFSIIFLSIKNYILNNKNYFEKYNFEKAYVISLIFLMINHFFDVVYFDGRISIASWLLISGLRNMNSEKKVL